MKFQINGKTLCEHMGRISGITGSDEINVLSRDDGVLMLKASNNGIAAHMIIEDVITDKGDPFSVAFGQFNKLAKIPSLVTIASTGSEVTISNNRMKKSLCLKPYSSVADIEDATTTTQLDSDTLAVLQAALPLLDIGNVYNLDDAKPDIHIKISNGRLEGCSLGKFHGTYVETASHAAPCEFALSSSNLALLLDLLSEEDAVFSVEDTRVFVKTPTRIVSYPKTSKPLGATLAITQNYLKTLAAEKEDAGRGVIDMADIDQLREESHAALAIVAASTRVELSRTDKGSLRFHYKSGNGTSTARIDSAGAHLKPDTSIKIEPYLFSDFLRLVSVSPTDVIGHNRCLRVEYSLESIERVVHVCNCS